PLSVSLLRLSRPTYRFFLFPTRRSSDLALCFDLFAYGLFLVNFEFYSFFSFTCIHHLFHPSSFLNQLSQLDSFSTIFNIAYRDRLFSFFFSSVCMVGLRVIYLNCTFKSF